MRSTVHEQPRALLTLLFALNFGLAIAEANTPQPLLHTLQRPPQSLKLDCYATAASSLLMRRAAGSYAFMRPDLLLTIQTVEDTPAVSGSQILFDHMQSGEADYAFSTLVPTDSQKEVAPDLMHYPAAAFPFGAIYSLPLLRSTLVLDIKTLARIYSGNITRWDDPAIQSLNPDALMPDRGIEVVLLGTSNNYIKAATASFRDADQDFANRIEESPTPHWPTSRYYKYTVVMGVDGPAAYVAAVPYSIGLSFLFQATAMQVRIANILKSDGTIVQPTFESIQSAFSDQAVKTVFDAEDGNIEVQQVDYVSDAPGQNSWPMMIQGTFTLAKEYSRSSCQQRTELIKFLLFMLDSETVQYVIAQKLLVALSSEELDSSIGLRAALQSDVKCEDLPINVGKTASTVTSVGYALLGSTHTNVRSLLISVYAVTEQSTQYSMVLLDELQQINLMLKANRNDELDIAWIFPVAFKHMYPGVIETSSIVNSLSYFPSAVIGVMPTYSLHPSILVQMQNMNALPLKIDLETLAGIFLGSISSWLDPAILAFNPKLSLAHQAETQVSTKIKLILFGKGKQSDAPLSALSNHLIIALNHTKTFKQSGIDWRLPADWTKVTDKLDATRYEYVTNEASLTTQISYNFGSIGYKLITSNTTDPTTDFDLIRTVHTFLGTQQSITIQGTPQSLINCLEAASIPDFDPLANIDLEAVINDQSYAGASCWPFFILNTLVLPTDVDSTALDQLGTDASNEQITRIRNNLCFHRTKVVQFMSWMAINPQLNIATSMLGRGGFTMSQRWITAMQNELRELKCLGKYMLHTPSIQWIVSPAIFQFVLIASSVGFFGILVSAFVVARFRKRTLIVSSDILLQACGLIGTALLLISAVLFVQPASPSLCSAVSWLLSLGLTATLAPQSLKMFKVYYTVTHVRRKRKPLFRTNDFTNCNMYYVIGSLLGIDIALLIAAQIPSTADGLLDPLSILHNKGLDVYQYTTCAPPSNSMPYAVPLIAIKALILLIGSWLAFKSRHVSSAFGESTKISWSLWSATVSGIIILPLIVLTGGTYDDLYVFLVCFFVLWLSLGSLFLQFGYKVLAIFNEMMEERAQNQRIASSHRSSNPSGTQSGTSTGTTGTNTGTGTGTGSLRDSGSLTATGSAATHMFPELNQVSIKLPTLERYINCLESELAKARQHRLKKFGSNGTATGAAYGLGPARLSADRVNANESKKLKLDIPAAENDMHFKSSNNIIISPSSRGTLSKGVKNSSFSSKLASPSAVQFMTPTPSVLLAGGTPSPSQSYSTAPAERRRITLRQSLSPSSAGGVRGPANSKPQSQPLPAATGSSSDFILSDCQPMAASRSRFTTSITLPPSASSSSTAVVDPAPSPLSLNGSASEGNTQTWQMSKPPPSKGAKSAILLTPTVATSPNGSSSGSNSSTAQGVSSLVNAGAAIFRLRNLENTLHQLHVIASNASSSPHRSPATRHRSLKNPAPGAPDSIQETAELSSLGGGTKSTSTSGHHSRDNSAGSLNAHQAQSPSKSRSPGTIMSRLNIGVWTNPGTPPNNDVVAMRDSVNKTP